MILGLQLYGPLAKQSMDEKELLCKAKEIGFMRVEPCITFAKESDNPSFWTVKHFVELYPYLQELGLEVISCHIAGACQLEYGEQMCMLAKEYGMKHFIFGTGDLAEEKLQEKAFVFRVLGDVLAPLGARILLHNGKPDVMVKIGGRTAYEYLVDICQGRVGMQFDVGWCIAGGVDPLDIVRRNEKRIESLHFKDFKEPGISDVDCIIGQGVVDSPLFMQFGRANGIPLFVDQDMYEDVAADAAKSYWYLIDEGQQRQHTVSYLNIFDTQTKKVTVLKKFDEVIEAPNWVDSKNCLIYNKGGALYRFDLKTMESVKIDTGIANSCNNDHVVSADEKLLAVSSDYKGASRIFVLPIDGGEATLITEKGPSYLHGISPDGKELAYCAFREIDGKNAVDVYAIGIEEKQEKRLTKAGFNDGPEYSPDGKHIWYISTASGLMQVYRMNTDGSDIKQMTFEEQNNWFGHVSPDCKKVVNLSYRKGDLRPDEHLPNMEVDLWMMDYDGSNREKLFTFFGGQGSINVNSWSKDSRYFAFVSYDVRAVK